jgi:hypothetical protein
MPDTNFFTAAQDRAQYLTSFLLTKADHRILSLVDAFTDMVEVTTVGALFVWR